MNKTQWYPADISPVRNGLYETKHYLYGTSMQKWSDGLWTDVNGRFVLNRSVQRYSKWRGLLRKAQEK